MDKWRNVRCPSINEHGYIRLVKARHPLISPENAVTNTIEFGKDITSIVITGPNTGGKTVTLKTVGLMYINGTKWNTYTSARWFRSCYV